MCEPTTYAHKRATGYGFGQICISDEYDVILDEPFILEKFEHGLSSPRWR